MGDIFVYDVDLTASDRPLLMMNPTVAVVTPQRLAAETRRFSATGSIGQSSVDSPSMPTLCPKSPFTAAASSSKVPPPPSADNTK